MRSDLIKYHVWLATFPFQVLVDVVDQLVGDIATGKVFDPVPPPMCDRIRPPNPPNPTRIRSFAPRRPNAKPGKPIAVAPPATTGNHSRSLYKATVDTGFS